MADRPDVAQFLTRIRRRPESRPGEGFPWSVPLFRDLDDLRFTAPVTFLVGENGSGKSTLLEGLAAGMGAVAAGSADLERDDTLDAARSFASAFQFVRRRHPRSKLFLRAEDVFGFTLRVAGEMAELQRLEEEFERALPDAPADAPSGRERAMGLAAGQRRALAAGYGQDPNARSHGETFLGLLLRRLAPHGLHFLDEPETPLSPTRVLSLLSLLKERVAQDCQFVIATHSPILMALPGAQILLLDEAGIRPVAYDDVEHVRVTRDFLNNPASFLQHL